MLRGMLMGSLAVLLSASACTATPTEQPLMQQNPQAADALLDVPRAVFFDLDDATEDALLRRAVADGAIGIRIAAPEVIDPSTDRELPLLYLRHTTGLRDWQVEFERNSHLVAANLLTGEVRSNWAFPTGKRFSESNLDVSRAGTRPEGDAAQATNTEIYRVDARDVLKLDWREGAWALTMSNYDGRSNTVPSRIGHVDLHSTQTMPTAEALAALETSRAAGVVDVGPADASDALASVGAQLSGPARIDAGAASGLLRARLKTALAPAALVADGGGSEVPSALIRVTILVAKLDALHASRVDLAVPVWSTNPLGAGEVVDVGFSVELAAAGLLETVAKGESVLYLVCGDLVSEPLKINAAAD